MALGAAFAESRHAARRLATLSRREVDVTRGTGDGVTSGSRRLDQRSLVGDFLGSLLLCLILLTSTTAVDSRIVYLRILDVFVGASLNKRIILGRCDRARIGS